MALVNVASYHRFSAYFGWGGQGWSEHFVLTQGTIAEQTTLGAALIKYRMNVAASSVSLIYSRLTKVLPDRTSFVVNNDTVAGGAGGLGAPVVEDCNNPGDCAVVRFQGENGNKSIRDVRGLPDSQIIGKALVPAAPAGTWLLGATPPNTPAGADIATYAGALKAYLSFVYYNTLLVGQQTQVDIGGTLQPGYKTCAFSAISMRKIGFRKTGAPFGQERGRAPIR